MVGRPVVGCTWCRLGCRRCRLGGTRCRLGCTTCRLGLSPTCTTFRLGDGKLARLEHFHSLKKVDRNGQAVHAGDTLFAVVAAPINAVDKTERPQLLQRRIDGPL